MQKFEKQVRAVMGKVLGVEEAEILADVSRKTLPRWDSLKHMNLMLALEDEFGIEFTDQEIAGIADLKTLIESVEEKCS